MARCAVAATILLIAAAQGSSNCPDAKTMLNVDWLFAGYDLIKGNPLHTDRPGVDPGFTRGSIFRMTYERDQCTGDLNYKIPDGLNLRRSSGCVLEYTAKDTFKTSECHHELESKVTASTSFLGFSFSASTDFQTMEDKTTKEHKRMIHSTAECVVYNGGMETYLMPALHPEFLSGVRSLPARFNTSDETKRAYFDFLAHFGTHYVTSVDMGSRAGYTYYFTEDEWSDLEKKELDIDVAASYSGLFSASLDTMTDDQKTIAHKFDSVSKEVKEIVMGAKPQKNAGIWESTVVDSPMPIYYTLDLICHLFPAANSTLKQECDAALREYCEKAVAPGLPGYSCKEPDDPRCIWDSDCQGDEVCQDGTCVENTKWCGSAALVIRLTEYMNTDDMGMSQHVPGDTFDNFGPMDCHASDDKITMWRPQGKPDFSEAYPGDYCFRGHTEGKPDGADNPYVMYASSDKEALRDPNGMGFVYNDKDKTGDHSVLHHGLYLPTCDPGYVPLGIVGNRYLHSNDNNDQGGDQDHPSSQPIHPYSDGIKCVKQEYTKQVDFGHFWSSDDGGCGHFHCNVLQPEPLQFKGISISSPCWATDLHDGSSNFNVLDDSKFCECPCSDSSKIGVLTRSGQPANALFV